MAAFAQAATKAVSKVTYDAKTSDLKNVTVDCSGDRGLTTDHGVKIPDTDNWSVPLDTTLYIFISNHVKGLKFPTGSTVDLCCSKIRSVGRNCIVSIMNVSPNELFTLVVLELMAISKFMMTVPQNSRLHLS